VFSSSSLKNCFLIVTCCLVQLITVSTVNAQVFRSSVTPPNLPSGALYNLDAGKVNFVESIFNATNKNFSFTISFAKEAGKPVADGFRLVVNGTGASPQGYHGELPIFYFDGKDVNNPVLSAYVYNGSNSYNSHIDSYGGISGDQRDMIFSSKISNTIVKQIQVSDSASERVFNFILDVTKINSFVPKHSSNGWKGVSFSSVFGMWLHSYASLTTSYDLANGWLNSWSYLCGGWLKFANGPTQNENPICVATQTTPVVIKPGIVGKLSQTACDPVSSLAVSVSGLDGKDASFTAFKAPSNPPNYANWSCTTTDISFTPKLVDVGSHTFNVSFTDSFGATAVCPVKVTVPNNTIPVCDPPKNYENQKCQGESSKISFSNPVCRDADNNKLSFTWKTTCPQASIVSTANGVEVTYASEVNKVPSMCEVTATVSDGFSSVVVTHKTSILACSKDCKGVVNGTSLVDRCGVCGGDGNSCLDCKGIPNGNSKNDSCGICGGDGSSCIPTTKECPISGMVKDVCGICGGDGSTCLDCKGMPNGTSKIDQCGVCGGDGTSCLACSEVYVGEDLIALDSGLKDIDKYARVVGARIKKQAGSLSPKTESLITNIHNQYLIGWTNIHRVPYTIRSCDNTVLCSRASVVDFINIYRNASTSAFTQFKILVKEYQKLLVSKGVASARARKDANQHLRRSKKRHQRNLTDSQLLPISTSVCK
jgi:hypothetical protein